MNLTPIIASILDLEKGYVNHPSDRGGPTNFGITEAVARANGWTGDMRLLSREFAVMIYTKRYILEPKFDKIADISEDIGEELIDTGVNMGPAIASIFFQRLLNAFNAKGAKYANIFVDGRIGPRTIEAFKAFIVWRKTEGETTFLKALNGIQAARYLDIAEKNETQEDFFYGWIKNRT
jgi:lysozyme family protein